MVRIFYQTIYMPIRNNDPFDKAKNDFGTLPECPINITDRKALENQLIGTAIAINK